jgi:hypothetical protein
LSPPQFIFPGTVTAVAKVVYCRMNGYNVKGLTLANAKFIIENGIKTYGLVFPGGYEELKSIYREVYEYMKSNAITENDFFQELEKNINNMHVSENASESFRKETFEHLKSTPLAMHAELIALKFRLPYNRHQ